MDSETDQLHILFFPLMAKGHLIPTLNMVRHFAPRGVKTTIITTAFNAPLFSKSIGKTHNSDLKIIKFPAQEAGLPEGLENLDDVASPEHLRKYFAAISMLQQPLQQILEELRPHGLVADMFFPWATDIAAKYRVPTLIFHGTSFIAMCATECISEHQPHKNVKSDTEPFVMTGLPGEIKFTRMQLPDHTRSGVENDFTRLHDRAIEAEKRSFGLLVNSFYELESDYADHYRKILRRKAWHIGPVSLSRRDAEEEKAQRGKHDCLKWLDSKKPNSVVYVCFGTVTKLSASQLQELAIGLEASGQEFIWVVRKSKNNQEEDTEDWQPEGFEKRMEGKGLIIREWAPQALILDHESVGGFVTHCGWNSTLEGLSAGLPMATWPIFAEQFYNEKLVVEVLKTGVGVGAKQWVRFVGDYVKSEGIEKAVREIMVGEKAEEMRRRAKKMGEMAKRAVEEGGSSYNDLGNLIEELRLYRNRG